MTLFSGEAGRRWLKRGGIAAFLFFLIKGLLWLLVPATIVLLA